MVLPYVSIEDMIEGNALERRRLRDSWEVEDYEALTMSMEIVETLEEEDDSGILD